MDQTTRKEFQSLLVIMIISLGLCLMRIPKVFRRERKLHHSKL
jgi:competence protein ComGC